MKLSLFTTAFLLVAIAMPAATSRRTPNIVLIFADDLGYRDTGFTGSPFFETPNLDQLAKRGMIFDNAYAGAGNCVPSRATLHSGQYSPRTGVYAVRRTDRGPKELQRLMPIPNREDLALENVTVAEALKAGGYATGLFGKWHLSGTPGVKPTQQGFDVHFESMRPSRTNKPEDPKVVYSLTRAAIAFMEEHRAVPFFAFIAHHAIHSPLEARPSSLQKFQAKAAGHPKANALYAACIYDLDDAVGKVVQALRDLKLEDNTLIIFTSDNGATPQSPQEPLRGNKGCYYEGGIREPWIAVWPGMIPAGSRSTVPVINTDLYPTFLAAAGAKVPSGKILDGENLLPVFTRQADHLQRQTIYWHFPGYLDSPVIRGRDPVFRTRPVTAMRSGKWKLHLYHEEWQLDGGRAALATNHAVELYDLENDPGERVDVALRFPGERDRLLDEMLAWMAGTGARMPSERNPAYNPHAKPNLKKAAGKASADE